VLAADGLHDPLPDQIVAELGQGPASIGQPQLVGGLVSDPNDGASLDRCQARPGTATADSGDDGQAVSIVGVEEGVNRVGMERKAAGDLDGIPAAGIHEEDLGPMALGRSQVVRLETLEQITNFGMIGLANGQGARHGGTSGIREGPLILTDHRWQIPTGVM
jgi:hypothetical protein